MPGKLQYLCHLLLRSRPLKVDKAEWLWWLADRG